MKLYHSLFIGRKRIKHAIERTHFKALIKLIFDEYRQLIGLFARSEADYDPVILISFDSSVLMSKQNHSKKRAFKCTFYLLLYVLYCYAV